MKKIIRSNNFAQRLQKIRELRGLSQTELAKKLKLPQSSISHFEAPRRTPNFSNLKKIADALHVSADYLLGRTDNHENNSKTDELYKNFTQLSDQQRYYVEKFIKSLKGEEK